MKIWLDLLGQRTGTNSSLQDVSRVKYLHGYIGGVLDALRYAVDAPFYVVGDHITQIIFITTAKSL